MPKNLVGSFSQHNEMNNVNIYWVFVIATGIYGLPTNFSQRQRRQSDVAAPLVPFQNQQIPNLPTGDGGFERQRYENDDNAKIRELEIRRFLAAQNRGPTYPAGGGVGNFYINPRNSFGFGTGFGGPVRGTRDGLLGGEGDFGIFTQNPFGMGIFFGDDYSLPAQNPGFFLNPSWQNGFLG